MAAHQRRTTGGLASLALAIATALTAGCTTSQLQTEEIDLNAHRKNTVRDDVETIIQRHRSELETLADRANADNIERGGVIVSYNGTTRLIEIHNQFKDGPQLIDEYCAGNLRLYSQLDSLIGSAASARAGCNPSGAANYYARAGTFRSSLNIVQAFVGKDCQTQNYFLQSIFAEIALHTTYLKGEKEYDAARRLGEVILHVHTHNDTRTTIDDDTTDYLAPSRQDLLISEHQEGIVSGVNAAGEHRIYYSSKGKYRLLPPETSLALR